MRNAEIKRKTAETDIMAAAGQTAIRDVAFSIICLRSLQNTGALTLMFSVKAILTWTITIPLRI